MSKPNFSRGPWQVTRWCCRSALCIECHARGNHGDLARRTRIIHTDEVSEEWARFVAANWQDYGATAERMPAPNNFGLDELHADGAP